MTNRASNTTSDCSSARVIKVVGDEVQLEVNRNSACEHCSENGSCGMMLDEGNKSLLTIAVNRAGASPGDLVEVSLDSKVVTWAALLLYIFPLIGLFLGVIVGSYSAAQAESELSSTIIIALYGLVGLVVFLLATRFISARLSYFREGKPVVTRIVEKSAG